MLLLEWQKREGLTVTALAERLGFKSVGMVSDIGRGRAFPRPETIYQIDAATLGEVRANDHVEVWAAHNRKLRDRAWKAGRTAARKSQSGRNQETNGTKTERKGRSQAEGQEKSG